MSYCRWSSDDFASDLYIYEDVMGAWTIHVAGNRVVGEVPPMDHSFMSLQDKKGSEWEAASERFVTSYRAQMNFLKTAERVDIDLPFAGQTFNLPTPGECADKVEELIALGYRCPDGVVTTLRTEQVELDSAETTN